jgi:hypothetical protein
MSGSRARRTVFGVLAAVFALGAFGGLFGFALFTGWFSTEDGGIHRVHYLGFGILFGALLTSTAVALAVRRREDRPSAFLQVVAVGVAAILGALASTDGNYLVIGIIVAAVAAILFAVHPARASVLRPGADPSPLLGSLAAVGAIPLMWFGLTMARLQRDGLPTDPHVKGDHWANMAAMAFGLALAGLLAAMRIRGWRLTAWCAGLGVAVFGLASIVFARIPGTQVPYPGSEGVGWGVVALVGGVAFVAVAEWEARRSPAAAPREVPPGAPVEAPARG